MSIKNSIFKLFNSKKKINLLKNNKSQDSIDDFILISDGYINYNENELFSSKNILKIMNLNNNLLYEQNRNIIISSIIINGTNKKLRYDIWNSFIKLNKFKIINQKEYEWCKNIKSSYECQIIKDINRTIYPLNLNNLQKNNYIKSVNNILTAYTNDNPRVGYVQGMNMIATSILYSIYDLNDLNTIEYKAYIIFYSILNKFKTIKIYKNKMSKIFDILNKLKSKIKNNLINVYNKLNKLDFDFCILFTGFYFSLLMEFTELEMSYRIIDIFIIYGFKIINIFIYTMLKLNKNEIISIKSNDKLILFLRKKLVKSFFNNYEKNKFEILKEIDLNKDFYHKTNK